MEELTTNQYSKNVKHHIKVLHSLIQSIMWSLFLTGAFFLIAPSLREYGVGILSSSIVSITFYYVIVLEKRIYAKKKRANFFDKFIIGLYNQILDFDTYTSFNEQITLNDFLRKEHRCYHECYKRIIAKNSDSNEVKELMSKIIENVHLTKFYFIECENNKIIETERISSFFTLRKKIEYYSDKQDIEAIGFMADYITDIRHLIEYIPELKHFASIKYVFTEGELEIHRDTFFKEEKFIKFANDFNNIRRKNIIKKYGKEKNDIET